MHVYTSGHVHSLTVCTAFAQGGAFPLVRLPCALEAGPMMTYGNLRGLDRLLDEAKRTGRDWYYGDNGYFRPGHYDGYFRVTRNAEQHDGAGASPSGRWAKLGKPILPWRRGGRSIVVCPPGEVYARMHGFDAARWLSDALRVLRDHTDRSIRIRVKPRKGEKTENLWTTLTEAHALVTHGSNSAVEALLYGVPVFCTGACAASRMGLADLTRIETPHYPDDRAQWAANLAANQWTLDEMRDGTCWRELQAGHA